MVVSIYFGIDTYSVLILTRELFSQSPVGSSTIADEVITPCKYIIKVSGIDMAMFPKLTLQSYIRVENTMQLLFKCIECFVINIK